MSDAPVGRQRAHAGHHIVLIVIDHVVGAELTGAFELAGAAGGGDDARVKRLRDLYGGLSNAAAGREHEHRVPLLHRRTGPEHLPRRQERERKRGRGLVRT
jgi:hypothetical protein